MVTPAPPTYGPSSPTVVRVDALSAAHGGQNSKSRPAALWQASQGGHTGPRGPMLKQHEDRSPRNGQVCLGIGSGGESTPRDGPYEPKYEQSRKHGSHVSFTYWNKTMSRIGGPLRRNRSQTCHGFKGIV